MHTIQMPVIVLAGVYGAADSWRIRDLILRRW